MTTQSSVLRKASARFEALEARSLFSGEIDHGFGDRGLVETTFPPEYSDHNTALVAKAITVQADGKVIVVSQSSAAPDTAVVARFGAYGAVDKTFGTNGFATVGGVKAGVIDNVTVLANGKIQVGGQVYFRLTSAGKLDSTYGGGDGIAWSAIAGDRRAAQADVIQSDGSVLELQAHAAGGKNVVTKYRVDGSVDTTFAVKGVFSLASYAVTDTGGIATDAKGRVYVSYLSSGKLKVLRLTSAGKLDTTWNGGGVATGVAAGKVDGALTVLSDGRVLATYDIPLTSKFTTGIDVFAASGANVGLRLPSSPASAASPSFAVQSIKQNKDGSVFYAGTLTFPAIGTYSKLPTSSAVMHVKSDLSLDTGYSADGDGLGGFSGFHQDTAYVGSAFTSAGSAYVIGKGTYGNSYLSRLTPLGQTNHLSVKTGANNTITITNSGTNADVEIRALHYTAYNDPNADHVVFLDDDLATSVDLLYYKKGQALSKLVVNLGDQSDRFIGSEWTSPVTVNGGAGNDYIVGGLGDDSLSGGDGDDDVEGGNSLNGVGGDGNDTIHGDAGNDRLVPLYGHNVVYGDAGRDTITNGGGVDTYYGGADNDTFNIYGNGFGSYIDGGTGTDTAFLNGPEDQYTLLSIEVIGGR